MSSAKQRWLRDLFAGLLVLLLLAQLWVLVGRYGPELARIRQDVGKSGVWRGANFAFNRETADYLAWVSELVSVDAEVLVGADTGPEALSRPASLHIFLYPRHLYNCPGTGYADCVVSALAAGRAILVTDPERINELIAESGDDYRAFNADWGLLYLGAESEAIDALWQDFPTAAAMALSFLPPLAALFALALAGFLIIELLTPDIDRVAQFALGFGLAASAYSLMLYMALLVGLPLSPALAWGLLALLLAAPLLRWPVLRQALARRPIRSDPVMLLILLGFGAVTLLLAAGRGFAQSDEYLLWGAKAYGIPAAGLSTAASDWGTLTTRYPLNIPLLISSLLTQFGEQLPESKLLFSVFFMSLLAVVAAFLRKRLTAGPAALGLALLASTPLLFQHGTLAYANLPYTFFFVGAWLVLLDSGSQAQNWSPWLAGLLLAGAAWTRPEALAINLVLLAGYILIRYRPRLLQQVKDWWPLVMPSLIYALFWYSTNSLVYTRGGFASGLLEGGGAALLSGNLNLAELGYLLARFSRMLASLPAWGSAGALMLAVLLLAAVHRRWLDPESGTLLVLGLGFIAIILGSYYLTSYDPQGADISWWVSTGLDRMLMPGMTLLWIAGFLGSQRLLNPSSD
jgi:hypothetical protein